MGGAFAQHWGIIVVVRALVGAFEAGFFPGCIFLITVWYVYTHPPFTFFFQIFRELFNCGKASTANTLLQV